MIERLKEKIVFPLFFVFCIICFSEVNDNTNTDTILYKSNNFYILESANFGEETIIIVSDETNWCIETNNYAVPCWVHPSWVRIDGSKWIWRDYLVSSQTEECTIIKEFEIPGDVKKGILYAASDNECDIWVNDKYAGNTSPLEYEAITTIDITSLLKTDVNYIKLWGRNRYWFPGAGPYVNPAGIIYKIVINYIPKKNYIFIDPGHGKYKWKEEIYYRGAVGPTYGDKEDDLNLDMGIKLKEKLKDNYKAEMTRQTEWDILPDSSIGIENPPPPDTPIQHNNVCVNTRVKIANDEFKLVVKKLKPIFNNDEEWAEQEARKRMIFVSIHCNSSNDYTRNGTGILYNPGICPIPNKVNMNNKLRQYILSEMEKLFVHWEGDSGIYNKAIIRDTEMPAVIIETVFLTNTISDAITDEQFLHFEEYRDKIPEAIYEGIIKYFKSMEDKE
ncbi:MAG: N-acetylmuramoyl-L-alanine amidase [Candidatus Ratteibacteria bacterium]